MSNERIIDTLSLMASLLELHAENEFKIRSYQSAIFNLEKSTVELSSLSLKELEQLPGIGKSIAAAIFELASSGQFSALQDLLNQTPSGVVEMLSIKGIGPKKIRTIWKELEIESTEALYQACDEHKVAKLKGFGEKTEENIKLALLFKAAQKGKLRYAQAHTLANQLIDTLNLQIQDLKISESGEMRRRMEVVAQLELVAAHSDLNLIRQSLSSIPEIEYSQLTSGPFMWRGWFKDNEFPIVIRLCAPDDFARILMLKTGSATHLNQLKNETQSLADLLRVSKISSEEAAYQLIQRPYIAPELREGRIELQWKEAQEVPKLVEPSDLKGILHNHSTYSDGKHTLKEMAEYCKELGYEYLGISDHSQSAFYANGLDVNRIRQQHQEIDALNQALGPFRIFKGIESDILNDGQLDYPDEVLASFDFIVASIHSNLKMDIKKATDRLIKAIANPYTTILGHPTGRLLLVRDAYPIDHQAVIDACAEYGVVIEINASPWRLDLDWRYVHYAIEKGVKLSINPDAHEKQGFHDMYYGLLAGRKGGLTKEMTFNALSQSEIENHFTQRKVLVKH